MKLSTKKVNDLCDKKYKTLVKQIEDSLPKPVYIQTEILLKV